MLPPSKSITNILDNSNQESVTEKEEPEILLSSSTLSYCNVLRKTSGHNDLYNSPRYI